MRTRLRGACIGVLLASPQAIAGDDATSPTRMAITLRPLTLLQPRVALELDLILPDRFRIASALSIGQQNGPGVRLSNLRLDAAGLDPLTIRTVGAGIAVERFFKAPDRGFYAGGTALVDRYRMEDAADPALGYASLRIGPTVGWKGIGDRGLSFSIDAGPAYGAVFALVGYPQREAQGVPRSSFTIIGRGRDDYAGRSVSTAGDVDGDGLDDLFVGAPNNDDGGSRAGKAYLILGSTLAASTSTSIDLRDADFGFIGESSDDNAGVSVSTAGDVDGDGLDDLFVGAWSADDGRSVTGKAYLILSDL